MSDKISEMYNTNRRPIEFTKNIRVLSCACVGGKNEKQGPLGDFIDIYCDDEKMSCKSWEQAESEMCRMALSTALLKGGFDEKNIDILIAGDLMNQCTGSGYGLSCFDIPYIGIYGACSTFAEGIMIAGIMIESGKVNCVAVVASSHFCTAERQYRFPLEYGAFSEASAQNTVTGAGCIILSAANSGENGVFLTEALPGIVCDNGIKDASNMGAAMSIAATDTLSRYFDVKKDTLKDFDLIATGDLGREGFSITLENMEKKHPGFKRVYNDCGVMIYDTKNQDVGMGGSGCACSALVFSGYIMDRLSTKKMKNVLLAGTGAMLNPQSIQQGLSIPSVAHAVRFESR